MTGTQEPGMLFFRRGPRELNEKDGRIIDFFPLNMGAKRPGTGKGCANFGNLKPDCILPEPRVEKNRRFRAPIIECSIC